jgi:hypothetical protein
VSNLSLNADSLSLTRVNLFVRCYPQLVIDTEPPRYSMARANLRSKQTEFKADRHSIGRDAIMTKLPQSAARAGAGHRRSTKTNVVRRVLTLVTISAPAHLWLAGSRRKAGVDREAVTSLERFRYSTAGRCGPGALITPLKLTSDGPTLTSGP